MTELTLDVNAALAKAVKHFWLTRDKQHSKQGSASGRKDAGSRGAVTGGKHADGFVELIAQVVRHAGLQDASIQYVNKKARTLPGFFRPSKEWDLVVVHRDRLVAAVEVKSQVGSFGNNFNNRVEEALGNATDLQHAYSNGMFAPSSRPWLGYLFMLEAAPKSLAPTKPYDLRPFQIDPAFQALSYAQRYEETCRRLVRERLYDAACFFTSTRTDGRKGKFAEPSAELSIRQFAVSLYARACAVAQLG
jgi:Restriction endonuclease XhoI